MVVVARAREVLRVGHTEVFANISSNPVRDILLVHGVLINFVGSRAGHVLSGSFNLRLDSKCKSGHFAHAVLQIVRVSEIEISKKSVLVGSWELTQLTVVVDALRCSKNGRLFSLLGPARVIVLRAHIHRVWTFPRFVLCGLLDCE